MEQLEDEDYNSGWSVMSVQNMKWNSKGAYFGASLSWCGFDASTLMFQSCYGCCRIAPSKQKPSNVP